MNYVKNSLIAIGILAIAVLTSISANASFLIEPHLGYNLYSSTSYNSQTIKYNGGQYGARLGVQSLGVMGGMDYTHATFTQKTSTSSTDFKRDEIGVFVGYNFPILLRAWLGYNFSAKETQTSAGGVGDYEKGTSTEIGVGYSGLPFISINLSYKMISYDKTHDAAAGTTSTLSPKFEPKEIVLGVSAPFTLL